MSAQLILALAPPDAYCSPTTALKSSDASETIHNLQFGRSGGSIRIPSPPMSLFQQPALADSVHERYMERQRVRAGQGPNRPSVSQQQQGEAHGYESTPQQTNAPVSQLPEVFYGHSPTYAAPVNSSHVHAYPHGLEATPSYFMYPPLPPAVLSQWNSSGGTQSQARDYATTFPQSIQAYQPQACISPRYPMMGIHPAQTSTGFTSSGSRSILQSDSPMMSKNRSTSGNAPPLTGPVSSSAGYRATAGGALPVSAAPFPDSITDSILLIPEPDRNRCLSELSAMTNSPHMIRPISPDDFVHTRRDASWESGEGVSFPHYRPEELSEVSILNPASLCTLVRPTPAEVISPGDRRFQVPAPLAQASPATSGQSTDTGAERSRSSGNIRTANGKPTSSNQQLGLNRRTSLRRGSKPYERPTPCTTHKTRPVPHEPNLERLQQRCRGQGADEIAVGFLPKIFANNGVSLEALVRPFTDAEVETGEFGGKTGNVYTAFLRYTQGEESGPPRHICRLCHSSQTWKHSKDVLRHLRRDHFGLSTICKKW